MSLFPLLRSSANNNYRILLGLVIIDIFTYSMLVPYFPSIFLTGHGKYAGHNKNAGQSTWGIAQTVGNLMGVFSGFCSGVLSDKFGRRGAVVCNQALAAVSCFGMAYGYLNLDRSFSLSFLIAGYVGRKGNRTLPLLVASMADITDGKGLQARLSTTNAFVGFAFALGPALGALLAGYLTTTAIFVSAGLMCSVHAIIACFLLHDGSHRKQSSWVTWSLIKSTVLNHKRTYAIHFFGCLGQQCYIATIGLVALHRFHLEGPKYGYLISFFGISYGVSQFAFVPMLSTFLHDENFRLQCGLLLLSISRLALGIVHTVPMLLLLHVFVGLGSGIFKQTLSVSINRTNKAVGGTKNGTADSIERFSGVIAPLIALPAHHFYATDTGPSPGAVLASAFYFLAFMLSVQKRSIDPPYRSKKTK
jgi:MFS family permease